MTGDIHLFSCVCLCVCVFSIARDEALSTCNLVMAGCAVEIYTAAQNRGHTCRMDAWHLLNYSLGHTSTPPGFVPSVCGEGSDKNYAITQRERLQSAGV